MELNVVTEAIKKWLSLVECKDTAGIIEALSQGNQFVFKYSFDIKVNGSYSEFLHAYPGILNGKLYFFIIPSNCDNAEGVQLPHSIQQVLVLPPGNSGGITPDEAATRIQNWLDYYPAWVSEHVDSEFGVFQAFAIPTSDLKAPMGDFSYTGYLALAPNPENMAMSYRADMVISETTPGGIVAYFDTVRPVPPFVPSYSAYYLLTISEP